MPINSSNIRVTVRSGGGTSNTQPVTLKSQARSVNNLADIVDVVESSPQDGFTLVYDSVTDKYIVKQLESQDINITALDGGTF